MQQFMLIFLIRFNTGLSVTQALIVPHITSKRRLISSACWGVGQSLSHGLETVKVFNIKLITTKDTESTKFQYTDLLCIFFVIFVVNNMFSRILSQPLWCGNDGGGLIFCELPNTPPQGDQAGFRVLHFKRQRIGCVALIAATFCISIKQFVEFKPGVAAGAELFK